MSRILQAIAWIPSSVWGAAALVWAALVIPPLPLAAQLPIILFGWMFAALIAGVFWAMHPCLPFDGYQRPRGARQWLDSVAGLVGDALVFALYFRMGAYVTLGVVVVAMYAIAAARLTKTARGGK